MEKPVRSSIQNLIFSYELALAIGNSLNLSEMLHEVIHTMVHKTNAHRGIIWVNNGEEELQPVASAGINIEDVLAQGGIMDIRDVLNQIQKRQQFVLRCKEDKDFLQYCPVLTEKEESVLIVPVTNVAILHLVYASREIADKPLANLLVSISKKLSVVIEACTAHMDIINEVQVREKAEKELTKKTEQLISSQKELQRLYGESEQARKSLLSILEDVTQKEEELKKAHDELEIRVKERTAKLRTTNETLQGEIVERKRAEEDLLIAKKIAESASRAKSEFLASMSHELRTPLNAINGFSELLQKQYFGELNEKQAEYVTDILESGKHLLSLINDILDLSKVEAGKMELELSRVNLKGLLENSLIMIKEKALKRGIKLDLHIAQELDELEITADAQKLKRIMFNLLSNAAKFTVDGGAIEVAARQEAEELFISVSDTGIGIAPEEQEKIFGEFYQIKSSLMDKTPGTGLGLPLTKSLVKLHGGRIWVESEVEGRGSRFSFSIPLKYKKIKRRH